MNFREEKENEFISSITSYHNGIPTEEYIQSLEDCEIVSFKKSIYKIVLKTQL
ncbi:MAG: hypothetical protein RL099_1662 [Bacteroidota bacterium]|jgi:hypothetical protein